MLYPGEPVFNSVNYTELIGDGEMVIDPSGQARLLTCEPRDTAYGSLYFATPFEEALDIIPIEEWPERIEEMDAKNMWLSSHCDFPSYDQSSLPYCWVYCCAGAATAIRRQQGNSIRIFSPESVGAPVSGYRRVGGWPERAMQYMLENGIARQELWPRLSVSRSNLTAEVREDYGHNLALELFDCPDDSFAEAATLLMLGHGAILSFNWWRHAVMGVKIHDFKRSHNRFGMGIRNSWGQWGTKNEHGHYGFGTLSGSKATPSAVIGLRQMKPS